MASSTATTTLPNQQQQQQQQPQFQQQVPYSQAVPSNSNINNSNMSKTSGGSIGPFFAVMSVLLVLSIISCLLGRFCIAKEETPLQSIKYRGSCFDRLRRLFRRPDVHQVGGGVRVASALPDERGTEGI